MHEIFLIIINDQYQSGTGKHNVKGAPVYDIRSLVPTHCQTTAPVSVFFDRPLFLGCANHYPLKSYFLINKSYTKVTPFHPTSISCNEHHVFPKID